MLLRHGLVQRGNNAATRRGGDDVIVRSRDHGGRPVHQRHHWLPVVKHTLMLLLLLMVPMMISVSNESCFRKATVDCEQQLDPWAPAVFFPGVKLFSRCPHNTGFQCNC